jgi:hypothetical protein
MADNVWTNINGPQSTSWTSSTDSSTSWTQTSGSSNILADYSTPYTTIGSFTSVAKATTSILGTKYHLNDNVSFNYGTDKDFQFLYDSSVDSMVVKSNTLSTSDSFMSVKNSSNEIFGITYDGILKLEEQTILNSTDQSGRLAFSSDELYISKG